MKKEFVLCVGIWTVQTQPFSGRRVIVFGFKNSVLSFYTDSLGAVYDFIENWVPNADIDRLNTSSEDHEFENETKIDDELTFFHDTDIMEVPVPMPMEADIKDELDLDELNKDGD